VDENKSIDTKIVLLKIYAITAFVLGSFFLVYSIENYRIVDENIISLSVTVLTVFVGLILILKGIKSKFLKSHRAGDVTNWLVINFLAIPYFLFSAGYIINGALDQQDDETFDVKVIEAFKKYRYGNKGFGDRYSYQAKIKNWRETPEFIQLRLNKDEYQELNRVKKGRYITVVTKPGLFNEEWIVESTINPVGKKIKTNNSEEDKSASGLSLYKES
jgi:uncharacterized membrane protein